MRSSEHFRVYEHNLRRIMLLDWLRDEAIRRRVALEGAADRKAEARPYWLRQADLTATSPQA